MSLPTRHMTRITLADIDQLIVIVVKSHLLIGRVEHDGTLRRPDEFLELTQDLYSGYEEAYYGVTGMYACPQEIEHQCHFSQRERGECPGYWDTLPEGYVLVKTGVGEKRDMKSPFTIAFEQIQEDLQTSGKRFSTGNISEHVLLLCIEASVTHLEHLLVELSSIPKQKNRARGALLLKINTMIDQAFEGKGEEKQEFKARLLTILQRVLPEEAQLP